MRRWGPGLALVLVACGDGGGEEAAPGPEPSVDALPSPSGGRALRFVDGTSVSGLDAFRQVNGEEDKPYITGSVGGGVGLLDHDGDGDLDVYLANGWPTQAGAAAGGKSRDALFANQGGRFAEATDAAGLGHEGWTCGVRAADVEGDGQPDLFLTCYGPNVLYRNAGGRFEERTADAGLAEDAWSTGACFLDFERDGDLDLYVANYVDLDRRALLDEKPRQTYRSVSVFYGPLGLDGARDRFYLQEEPGRFRDASASVGIGGPRLFGFQAVAFDHDQDGWVDVYVANDSVANLLWRNREGERFEDVAIRAGLAFNVDGVAQAGMGIAVGDYDGDLVADLYVTNFAEDYYTLYRGEGRGLYRDVTARVKLRLVTNESLGWGCGFADFDQDGDLDLFAVNGHVYPQVDRLSLGTSYRQKNLLIENLGGGRLRVPPGGGGPGFALEQASRGAATFDADGDGDLDLLIGNLDDRPTLLRNESDAGDWLSVELRGAGANRDAVGARVVARYGDARAVRWAGTASGFLSSGNPRLHFGLGSASVVDELEITWPDGTVERLRDLEAGRRVVVAQGQGVLQAH